MMTTKPTASTVSRGPAASPVPSATLEGTVEAIGGSRHKDAADELVTAAREEVREGYYTAIRLSRRSDCRARVESGRDSRPPRSPLGEAPRRTLPCVGHTAGAG